MNDQFDELAKGLAQSATRRQALRRFGVGLAGLLLATVGLSNKAEAARGCTSDADCPVVRYATATNPRPTMAVRRSTETALRTAGCTAIRSKPL